MSLRFDTRSMTASYRRLVLATLGTLAVLGVAAASSGAAMAADLHATGSSQSQGSGNGNGNGGGGNGGNGNGNGNDHGSGTATPELPAGVLFAMGLVPLGAALILVRRRRSEGRA